MLAMRRRCIQRQLDIERGISHRAAESFFTISKFFSVVFFSIFGIFISFLRFLLLNRVYATSSCGCSSSLFSAVRRSNVCLVDAEQHVEDRAPFTSFTSERIRSRPPSDTR